MRDDRGFTLIKDFVTSVVKSDKISSKGFTLMVDFFDRKRSFMSYRQSGFTLIELLVAFVIAAFLFVGGFSAYREFTRRQVLDNTYKELRVDLALARELSLSGEKPTSCSGPLVGYIVSFSSTSYSVAASCGVNVNVRTIDLSSGVQISGVSSFIYKPLGQGTDLTGDVSIIITQQSTGKTLEATITKEGLLQK